MIRGQVLGAAGVMPTEEIFAALLRVQDSLPPTSVPPSIKVSALVITRWSSKPSGKGASFGKSRNSFPPCKYCGKISHPAKKCWKEFGKPEWMLAATGGKPRSSPLILVAPAPVAPPFGNFQVAVSLTELAYL